MPTEATPATAELTIGLACADALAVEAIFLIFPRALITFVPTCTFYLMKVNRPLRKFFSFGRESVAFV